MPHAYKPTFLQPFRGKYQPSTGIYTLNIGSDAIDTEVETNEMQWLRAEQQAGMTREVTRSGVLAESFDATLEAGEFHVVENDELHLNGFRLPPFKAIVDGRLVEHRTYTVAPEVIDGEVDPTPERLTVRLPNPPVTGIRHDVVFIEYWFKELKNSDPVRKYGGVLNDPLSYAIIDPRIEAETTRPIQLQWRIAVHEDYAERSAQGLADADGVVNNEIIPLRFTESPFVNHRYARSPHDPGLFIAGSGVPGDTQCRTADGYVYAIPLLVITRINNSGYNEGANPVGGVDYVDTASIADRPDGKFANIIYDDQISYVYQPAYVGPAQLNRLYLQLEQYRYDAQVLRNKVNKLTYDLEGVNHVFRAMGYTLPETHDLEVYGVDMYRQFAVTAGATMDDDDHQIVYRRRRYWVGRSLKGKTYAVVPSLVDYNYEHLGALGDLYLEKSSSSFTLLNSGAAGLRLDVTALLVDNETVRSGEGAFMGMDGAIIDLGFSFNPDRHFVHILPLEDTNGKNGEIYVKFIDQEMIVYNTGITTGKRGKVIHTVNNRFQWVIIDTYAPELKNYELIGVNPPGQAGRVVTNSSFGEDFRLLVGTPIFPTSVAVDAGAIGELYTDVETPNQLTLRNTGSELATGNVQCLIFNDVAYAEFYDTLGEDDLDIAEIVDTPAEAVSQFTKVKDDVAALRAWVTTLSGDVSFTLSQVNRIGCTDKKLFTLGSDETFAYNIREAIDVNESTFRRVCMLLVLDNVAGSPTMGQYIKADAIAEITWNGDEENMVVTNLDDTEHDFVLIVR